MIIYDSSLSKLLELSNTELRVFIYLCSIGKNNIVDYGKVDYDKIGIAKKTIQNSVTNLVKSGMLYKTNVIGIYYIEPMFAVKGKLSKCIANSVCIKKGK